MLKSSVRPSRVLVACVALLIAGGCRAPFEPEISGVLPPPPPGGSSVLLPLRIGGLGSDLARSVVTDAAGNAYVAGYFAGTVDFDPGSGVTSRIATGPYDISVAKYAPDGSFLWVFAIGGGDVDVPLSIKLAPDGALYVTGYVTSGAICSGQLLPNGGGRDMLLMRISAAGTCDWAITVGSTGVDEGHELVVDASGDILVAGIFSGTVDFDPGAGTALLVSRGGTDGFVARYSSAGVFKNVVQLGGTDDDAANAITLRPDGDIMVAGSFASTAAFGTPPSSQQLVSMGGFDYFVARLNPALGLEWAIRGGGAGNDFVDVGGLSVSASGVTWVAGTFTGTAGVGPGAGGAVLTSHGDADIFVTNYDPAGIWDGFARTFGGTGLEALSAFTTDALGNLYLGGSFEGAVDFDPGTGTHIVTSLGSTDAFLMSLNSLGDLRWVNTFGAAGSGSTAVPLTAGLALASDGTVWAVGRFFGLVDFDPGSGNVSRQSTGDADQFIARFDGSTGALHR